MKKLLVLALTFIACCGAFSAHAEEVTVQNPMDWEISMIPKQSAEEQEAARWSIVVENELGVYAYDMSSLTYSQEKNGLPDKNIITVLTKTVFTNKDTLKKLNTKYAAKLAKKEKVQYCEIVMNFNLADKSYGVTSMDVYGSKKTLLEHQEKTLAFVPVPEGSFAEAMLEICQTAASEEKDAAEAGK